MDFQVGMVMCGKRLLQLAKIQKFGDGPLLCAGILNSSMENHWNEDRRLENKPGRD